MLTSMKVVGVGFLRTGTTSLTLALDRLGYGPCYHMRMLNAQPWRAADWIAAAQDGASADWDQIFAGYESTVGSPATTFWRELVDRWPDVKVILTVRPPGDWYDSAAHTIARALVPGSSAERSQADCRTSDAQLLEELQRLIWEREFGGRFADREHAIAAFELHISAVKAYIPADRLLVYHVSDGWQPLCAFLDVPVPDVPFPRENDREAFQRRQRRS